MSGLNIEDAPRDTKVTGDELVPVSDGGQAKSMSVDQIREYVENSIANAGRTDQVDISSNSLYLLKDDKVTVLTADVLANAFMAYGFGKTGVVNINGNEVVSVRDANANKTVTIGSIKTWLESNMTVDAEIDLSKMQNASTPLDGGTYILLGVGEANRRFTIAKFSEWVASRFSAYVKALTAVQSVADSDVLYVVQGDVAKKISIAQIRTSLGAGNVSGPSSTTENKVPQWGSSAKTLKDGLSVVDVIDSSTASGSNIPTVAAVKALFDNFDVEGVVKTSGDQTIGGQKKFSVSPEVPGPTMPKHAATKEYVDAKSIQGAVMLTGDQSVGGVKTFTSSPVVPLQEVGDTSDRAISARFLSRALSDFNVEKKVNWTSDAGDVELVSDCINVVNLESGMNRTLSFPAAGNNSRNFDIVVNVKTHGTSSMSIQLDTSCRYCCESGSELRFDSAGYYLVRVVESGISVNFNGSTSPVFFVKMNKFDGAFTGLIDSGF